MLRSRTAANASAKTHSMVHQVTLRPSGRHFAVEDGETLLAAAQRAGIALPYSCGSGSCGACKATVLAGDWRQDAHAETALSADERRQGRLLLCCARAAGDLVIEARELAGLGEVAPRRMPARIAGIERPAPDVAIVRLQLPASETLRFRAGQYVDVLLKDGARRSYSIANAPQAAAGTIELHIRHLPGGRFTDALFGRSAPALKERDLLRLEAPLGGFFLREDSARPIVLLASGTGFAPIKAIAERLFAQRAASAAAGARARQLVLYWGGRTRADLYLDELAQRWAHTQPGFRYVPVLSEPLAADAWSGRTGFVHLAVMADFPDLSQRDVYACGAPAMVAAARRDFGAHCGLPAEAFFADAFTSQADLAR